MRLDMKAIGILAGALLLGALPARAQSTASFMVLYDLDATAVTYCRVTGSDGSPFGTWIPGGGKIFTSGSSATTSEVLASSNPFTPVSVSDVVQVDLGTGPQNVLLRAVAARASAAQITVGAAWNIDNSSAGYNFGWKKTTCGTAATSGWISVAGFNKFTLTFSLIQISATGGVDVQMQCRGQDVGAQPVQVFPSCTTGACNTFQNYTTAGIASSTTVVGNEPWGECRIGVKIGSADDGGDFTTNAEQITAGLTLEHSNE